MIDKLWGGKWTIYGSILLAAFSLFTYLTVSQKNEIKAAHTAGKHVGKIETVNNINQQSTAIKKEDTTDAKAITDRYKRKPVSDIDSLLKKSIPQQSIPHSSHSAHVPGWLDTSTLGTRRPELPPYYSSPLEALDGGERRTMGSVASEMQKPTTPEKWCYKTPDLDKSGKWIEVCEPW